MKILHVINCMENGGMQSYLITLNRNIDTNHIQFDYLVYNDNPLYYSEIEDLGGRVFVCPQYKNRILKILRRSLLKYRLLRKGEYTAVHVHVGTPAIPYLGFIERISGIKNRIYHCHCSERKIGTFKRILTDLCRFIMDKNYTIFIAVSEKAAEWGFSRKRVERKQYTYLSDGIEVDKFQFSEKQGNIVRKQVGVEKKIVLGNIGRFTEQKNQEFLLKILKQLNKKDKSYSLILVGEGPLESTLKEKAKEYGVEDDVVFYGTTKDVPSILSAMDLFLFPSLFEGLGIVAIEAQANGLFVLASNHVPIEAKVTNNFMNISIDSGVNPWVEVIIAKSGTQRTHNNKEIKRSIASFGYDISTTATRLSKMYCSISK